MCGTGCADWYEAAKPGSFARHSSKGKIREFSTEKEDVSPMSVAESVSKLRLPSGDCARRHVSRTKPAVSKALKPKTIPRT